MSIKVVTPVFRASYVKLTEPGKAPDGKMKYGVSMIFPKSQPLVDYLTKTTIKDIIRQVITDKFGTDPKGWPSGLKQPLRDGDVDRPQDAAYANSVFMNTSSKNRPTVLSPQKTEIIDPNEIYSGMWARASVNFYWYDNVGKGVGCGLNHVMKLKDDDRLDGRKSADEDFADIAAEQAADEFFDGKSGDVDDLFG